MNDHTPDQEDLADERAAAPTLAARYDAACRSIADLHAQLTHKQEQLVITSRALTEARTRIPYFGRRVDQKQAAELVPHADSLIGPSWMRITAIEERNGMLQIHGSTTLTPTETVNFRPAPGTPESAQWAIEEMGIDENEVD